MNNQFDVLIDSFVKDSIGIDNCFLSKELSLGLYKNILQLQKDNLMVAAGIGNEVIKDSGQTMRSDKIYWLDKKHDNIYERQFLHQVENFIERLNSTCYTGINGYEFHYAVYEQGSFYRRHKDQFKNNKERKYSLISYLNEEWQEEDGGQLMIYTNNTEQAIFPLGQRAVFFKADEMEHEVIKANRPRLSITGWLKSTY